MSPFITPLPIRAPVTTARARNADEFKGWGHRGALAMGAAPLYLPAEPWVGGLSGWGHSPEARPLRRDEREPSRISPIAACRVSHLHCRAGGTRGHVCTGEVHGEPQRWTKGRLRGWHGARVSGAGARGLWLLLFLPGSAGLAALLAPSSSNQVPASRPFCRL